MARLLAATGDAALPPAGGKERSQPEAAAPQGPTVPPPEPQEPARPGIAVPELRPVHVAEPEPDPAATSDQPATLEALAARFGQQGQRRDKAPAPASGARPAKAAKGAPDRSRQEREKQPAILARLRGEPPPR